MADQVLCEAGGFDLKGSYRLDEDARIDKEFARLEDIEKALLYDRRRLAVLMATHGRQLAALTEAQDHKAKELERLRPYWLPGMTKKQAVAAYLEANPGGTGPKNWNELQGLTVERLIVALQKAKDQAGAGAEVLTGDGDSVVSVFVLRGFVYVSDPQGIVMGNIRLGRVRELA
jgi:hypothetical protein